MIAKVLILCAALAAVHANGFLHGVTLLDTGKSVTSNKQDGLGNFAFGYDIVDGKGASNSRSEVGDKAGNRKGSYSLQDIDGRARRVDYVADAHGFRATVKTNEPGTAASAPAAALIASPYHGPVAPIDVNHAALGLAHGGYGLLGASSLGLGHGLIGYGGLGYAGLGYGGVINHGAVGHGVYGLNAGMYGAGIAHGLY